MPSYVIYIVVKQKLSPLSTVFNYNIIEYINATSHSTHILWQDIIYYYDFIFIIALFTRRVPMSFRKPPEWAHSVMTNCWRTRTIQQRCSALAGTKTTTSSHHHDPFVATSVCTCVCQISWLMTRRQFFFLYYTHGW